MPISISIVDLTKSLSTTGYIGFPIGNVQLVKVYVGLALASLVV
jgi:hypothetical protein